MGAEQMWQEAGVRGYVWAQGSQSPQLRPGSASCFGSVCSGLVAAVLHPFQVTLQRVSEQESVFQDLPAQRCLLLTF